MPGCLPNTPEPFPIAAPVLPPTPSPVIDALQSKGLIPPLSDMIAAPVLPPTPSPVIDALQSKGLIPPLSDILMQLLELQRLIV